MFKRIALSVLFLAAMLSAQVTGRLSGSVTDPTGAAIPGATVSLLLPGGAEPVFTAITTSEGLFTLTGVRPDTYDVIVDAAGFKKQTIRAVKVDPGRETSLPTIKVELGSTSESIEVVAQAQGVQTTNAEVSTTVTVEQMRRLPMLDRNPLSILQSQAGVSYNGAGATTINGQRVSAANVTLDGINIQDNFIRTNALDFIPNRLELDMIGEVTVGTSNAGSATGGGSAQVIFVTPSGSNDFHGKVYWQNRNSEFAANNWFNNRDKVAKPFLNQNQVGFSLGGPVVKDKLLFYGNYEAYRRRRQVLVNRTILTADARQGIFTYKDSGGNVRKINVLQTAGVQINPEIAKVLAQVPGPEKINNFRLGDSSDSLLRNTAGYSFNNRYNSDRNNYTGKVDYIPSAKHWITGTFIYNTDFVDRYDYTNDYSPVPKVANDNATKFLSATWRWNPTPALTNELRGGFNMAPGLFLASEKLGDRIVDGFIFSNPVNVYRDQGRWSKTYNYMDNAQYQRGSHSLRFGFQAQKVRIKSFNDAGNLPTYTIGVSSKNGLTNSQLPGIGSADLAQANLLLASLAGYVENVTQTFNITSRDSGYVAGATDLRRLRLDNYSGYLQDDWKVNRRLSLNAGVRYDYFTPVDDGDGLYILPVVESGTYISTLLSNMKFDFAGKAVGRPWYNRDLNNFGPYAGFAYDLTGKGKTALRGGYSIVYVNDDTIRAIDNNVGTNMGRSTTATLYDLNAAVGALPAVPTPAFKMPRTQADNYAVSRTVAAGMPDPNLRTPYVQQWSIGLQHEIKGTVMEARYVGNHTVKAFRAFDYNQIMVKENGFLDDFNRAARNGWLALAKLGTFNPAYNPNIEGSQPLTVFPKLYNGGLLTSSTVRTYLQQGQVGALGNYYATRGYNGAVQFYRNPLGLGMNAITNYSNVSYNALQLEARRRFKSLSLQANYTWSKSLSDAAGDNQTRFEAFLDSANPAIERARTPYDLRHAFKMNGFYDLPLGDGRLLSFAPLNRWVLGGWSVSGIFTAQSGSPFSILSGRATLNRDGRSAVNTATSPLTWDELQEVVRFRMTPAGPYFIAASALNPADNRGVAPDGQAPFAGQVFYHPAAGSLGTLQRRMFSGPSVWNLDFGVQKRTRITERQSVELRMEGTNILNHATFWIGDQTISSTTFGKITSSMYGSRLIQFALSYNF